MSASSSNNRNKTASGYANLNDKQEPQNADGCNQGNFQNAYQENIYDCANLGDNAYTDSAAKANPQLEIEL